MTVLSQLNRRKLLSAISAGALVSLLPGTRASAITAATGFRQGVAEAASQDAALAAFYRFRDFEGIWSGRGDIDIARRNAFLSALTEAPDHALPASRYDPAALINVLQSAQTPYEQGQAEVEMSRWLLRFGSDMKSGILTPHEVDAHIKLVIPESNHFELISDFAVDQPLAFLRGLPPRAPEYGRLTREHIRLADVMAQGGWGPVVAGTRYEPGESGRGVIALRNRLIAMDYLTPTATRIYNDQIEAAVQRFQASHGLEPDGVVNESTLAEINVDIEARMQSVLVAMERERWTNAPRGDRHVWVNLCDFAANIVDNDRITFRTRAVVGATSEDRQTPEFTELMGFLVINPSWSVPRSITTKEYLPMMQRNPRAAGHLQVIDRSGRVVNRGSVNFAAYNARNFPYSLRQAPSSSNALGVVKFMFPNPYNIYLHDTPAKDLFAREVRAFSHGCIRLAQPVDFAHVILARQTDDPEGLFDEHLRTGVESRVNLDVPIPVHLDYRTAFTDVTGGLEFRRDIYGRDGRIWAALAAEGVAVTSVRG
ncbi:MAG: L,D-transpeptidase family protein [Rhodobacterales bacterium]|nr:L,D-transpeptidase family protein [Rhodobacterales bacterium]